MNPLINTVNYIDQWEENGGGSKNAVDDYGEGEKHEIEDQHSQYPMSAALRVKKTGEDCNELNSRLSNGLDSLVEESLIDFGNKTLFNSDNNIAAPIKTKGKYGLVLHEHEGINSQPNIRASQIEGINLPVELRPAEIRKRIRSQCYEECMSSNERNPFENPITQGWLSHEQEAVYNEFQSTTETGRRLGVELMEDDVPILKKMIDLEAKQFDVLQRSSSAC